MIIPVRCVTCGKLISDKWEYYQKRLKEIKGDGFGKRTYYNGGEVPVTAEKQIFDELFLTRYCCRKVLLTHVDLIEKI
jgi:DNA-directed RNA polymerase I, II, and III subunit RPABC5